MENKYPVIVGFYIAREKTHAVEVKSWASKGLHGEDQWHWNVYGHVFEAHAWFDKPELLQSGMPLHYGPTLEEYKVVTPALGIKYDWQKEHKVYTFGSDYSHYGDPEDHPSPFDGIPWQVEQDALELAEWLKERAVKEDVPEVSLTVDSDSPNELICACENKQGLLA